MEEKRQDTEQIASTENCYLEYKRSVSKRNEIGKGVKEEENAHVEMHIITFTYAAQTSSRPVNV